MPYLSVRRCTAESANITTKVAALLTDLTAGVLNKKRELISASVEYVDGGRWFIGGTDLASRCGVTFFLETWVTEGTNTKEEKTAYVQQVFAALESLLGELEPASYIAIHEVRGDAWGYQGKNRGGVSCSRERAAMVTQLTGRPHVELPARAQ